MIFRPFHNGAELVHVKRRFAISTLLRVLCSLLLVIQGNATVAEAFQQSAANGQHQQTASSTSKQPVLEDGTPVKLRFSQTVSSEDAHVNDQVQFEVLEGIKMSDVVIMPQVGTAWRCRTLGLAPRAESPGVPLQRPSRSGEWPVEVS